MVDRCYVLTLAKRPERMERFNRSLPAAWPFPRPMPFLGTDGHAMPQPSWFHGTPGCWGCYRSHLRIWEDALTDRVAILVCEDDAAFSETFAAWWRDAQRTLPDDWDQVYFGGEHLFSSKYTPEQVSEHWLRAKYVARTHCYAIRGQMLAEAYKQLCETVDSGNQWNYHIDHRLGNLHLSGDWNVYAPLKWVVGQAAGQSDVAEPVLRRHVAVPEQWWNTFSVHELNHV